MKKVKLLLSVILVCFWYRANTQELTDGSSSKHSEAFKPSGKPFAKVFSNFHTDFHNPAFQITRAYLSFEYKF